MDKKEYIGWSGALCGDKVYVDLHDEGMAILPFKNRDEKWDMYCSHVRITVEKLSKDEFEDWLKHMKQKEKSNGKRKS